MPLNAYDSWRLQGPEMDPALCYRCGHLDVEHDGAGPCLVCDDCDFFVAEDDGYGRDDGPED